MTDMHDYDWQDEKLNRAAVLKLVDRHRDEYEELARDDSRATIAHMEETVRRYKDEVAKLKKKLEEQEARWKLRATEKGLVRVRRGK